jgi:C4-dicarboxylate-specific signal transduction histidine kinase
VSPCHDDDGRLTQWLGVNVDVEDRKRIEEDLRQSQNDFAHVARMMTMGELAVSIAHEVNQPLMAIVTNASACLRWLDDAKLDVAQARLAVQRIVNDGHRAGDIVTSIRSLARKSAPRMEQVGLEQVIQLVLELLRGEFQRRGVVLKAEFPRTEIMIFGDRTQLQQVVLNLIMNAVEAMAAVDNERRLTLRTVTREGWAQVSVQDTGPGLIPDHKDRVFEAFFSTKPEGIGMGLSICRSIIETHGGQIWASEDAPRGSTFSFTLPLAKGSVRDAN